ncbi:LOG family protein [Azohydromonas aeria]|uniref:LOG family protein n=1 Tax=Azohydromonas aeria TaxID=2590212 RepID=UPI0012FC1525|nr:TIGR00730 family Rossman fold protein [Azohydromonas aeria]
MRSVAVFCGSNFGASPAYAEGAAALGREIAARGLRLVYGGTNKGLMGVVADAVLDAGGSVVGVINQRLHARGHLHPRLGLHEVVASMGERKRRMAELADAFVALPGGLGTLEELFEAATLTQLGEHAKACGALNLRGYYEPLRALLGHAAAEGFMRAEHRDMLVIESDPARLLDALAAWTAPTVDKWIGQPGA